MQIEQLQPKYRALYGRWLAADPARNTQVAMEQFAEDRLVNLRAEVFPTLAELRTHVYALGKFMKRAPRLVRP